jgi:hypothetical protein
VKKLGLNTLILASLLSGSALGVNAATLNATSNFPEYNSDFTIEFTDSNNNQILDAGEVTLPLGQPSFSGLNDLDGNYFFSKVNSIPNIPNITNGFVETRWEFDTDGTRRLVAPYVNWNYEITGDGNVVIPEPMTILGTGLVAGFLPLLKRQKKSIPNP